MEQEILTLLRENNEMLKRICTYIDKVDSDNYRMNEDMKQFAINMSANKASEIVEQRCYSNNQQVFWR